MENVWATSDIARVAGVTTQAVTLWKRRHPTFPQKIGVVGGRSVYNRIEVTRWLKVTGRKYE